MVFVDDQNPRFGFVKKRVGKRHPHRTAADDEVVGL
jgi:hypothetical protein